MSTFNVTVVDQYNWLAGIVNSIVNVKPKIFSDYFLHSKGTSLIAGHLIPKELYFYDYSGAPRYFTYRPIADPECLGNHGFELMFLSGLGIPMLGTGDFSEAVRENIEILERTGDDIEIYTRNYSITATTGYNAANAGDGGVVGPNNSLRDYFAVDESASGYFSNVYGQFGCTNFNGEDPNVWSPLWTISVGTYVVPETTMDPYLVKVASFSGLSKAKDIIMPFDYNKNRLSPALILEGGNYFSNVGSYVNPLVLDQGPNSGKKFDSISMPFINYSVHTNEDMLDNDDPSLVNAGAFGLAQRIWNHKFLEAANLAVEGGISCGGIRGQQQILRNRHLITNRNLYRIFRYWSSDFKWVSINDVKAKALELDIPFELRRAYTPYKFKTSTFSINENASLTLINSGNPFWDEFQVGYGPVHSGFGGQAHRYFFYLDTPIMQRSFPYGYYPNYADDSTTRIVQAGRFGEEAPDSTIYFPNFNTGGPEANFFELIGQPTGTFTFSASGYSPWVYEAPNFVFDNLGEGDWCVPKSRETDIIESNILIHHTDSSNFTNFKLYKNDIVKTQSISGGCILQTKSTALDNTPRITAHHQPWMHGARAYVMDSEQVSLGGAECLADQIFPDRYRWANFLSKFTAQPVFEIDTDQEWKEIMAYSKGHGVDGYGVTAGLSPKYCFIEDLSSFGSIEKVFKKHIATVKFTPPSPTEGIEMSTMVVRGYEHANNPAAALDAGPNYWGNLCPPYGIYKYFTEDTGIIRSDYDTRTMRERSDFLLVSTIPEIDLNLFYKETASITGEAGEISVININGGTLIEGDEDGGIYQINLFVNDTISAE